MTDSDALIYLSEQQKTNTECTVEWIELESLYNDKLWTQLTENTISLINHPAFRNEEKLVQLYKRFISSFEAKIDPRKLVDIASLIASSMSDKKEAIMFLESIEDTVKIDNDALCHCYVLKADIQLNHFNDLHATKKIIDTLGSVIENATDLPAHWKMFSITINYHNSVGDQLEGRLNSEIARMGENNEKVNREIERLSKENIVLNEMIVSQRETFDKKLFSKIAEIEAKFTNEAVGNFLEVMHSQMEVSSLRKLNGRLLTECDQLRKEKNSVGEDKAKLESKIDKIITDQEEHKQALLLMGAHLKKLDLKTDENKSEPRN